MSNLRLINETTISATASTVNITNLFTSDFQVYKMIFTDFKTDTTGQVFSGRFIDAVGNVIQEDSLYDYAVLEMKSNGSSGEDKGTSQNNMQSIIGRMGDKDQSFGCVLYIYLPNKTDTFTFVTSQFSGMSGSNLRQFQGMFAYKKDVSVTGLQIRNNNNNFTAGNIRTFGIRVD